MLNSMKSYWSTERFVSLHELVQHNTKCEKPVECLYCSQQSAFDRPVEYPKTIDTTLKEDNAKSWLPKQPPCHHQTAIPTACSWKNHGDSTKPSLRPKAMTAWLTASPTVDKISYFALYLYKEHFAIKCPLALECENCHFCRKNDKTPVAAVGETRYHWNIQSHDKLLNSLRSTSFTSKPATQFDRSFP